MVFIVKTNPKGIDRSTQDSTWLFDKKKGLLICSLNAPSLLKHKVEIEMLLRENKIDILALIETKISETVCDSLIIIEGYIAMSAMTEIRMEEKYLFILKTPLLMIGYLTVILNQTV